MKVRILFIACVLVMIPTLASASFLVDDPANPAFSANGATFQTGFSGPGTLSPAIVNELGIAKKSIRVAAREFMSKPVSEALVKAAHSRVDIKVVLNKKTNTSVYSESQFLLNMSYPPRLTKNEDALHSDYIVVDDRDVIVGNIASFADEEDEKQNAASVIIIRNAPELAKRYLANFQGLWGQSVEMTKPKE